MATYAGIYTYPLVQLLPLIQQQLYESASFRGRASKHQLPAKVFGLFSISGLCAMAVAPPFARECEYIWDSQIRGAAVTQQLDDLYGAGNSDVDITSGYGGSRLITTAAVTLTTMMTATMALRLRLFAARQ